MYSMGAIYREFLGLKLPKILPNSFHYEHGWYSSENAIITDIDIYQSLMFVMSERRKKIYEEELRKLNIEREVIVTGSPFFMYRKIKKIEKSKYANGSVVFPCHSTKEIEVDYNIENFCESLDRLPNEFKPCVICLHWCDYNNKNVLEKYKSLGYKVVTAGFPNRSNNFKFVKNYYDILSNAKYTLSNEIGTYTFYSVEMGIPFSLINKGEVTHHNKGDLNLSNWNIFDKFKASEISLIMEEAERIFYGINYEVSSEQRQFVELEMGSNEQNMLNKYQLRKIVLKSYKDINYYKLIKKIILKIKNKIKYISNKLRR
ncbi:hypothetical protein [Clostridium sp. C8]|uniref:hypothetical protein n=1 Tax=Clostridium sp. C8 TaxID=1667357 RepID=UPI00062E6F0B|nr:hypothetical protein [Clostridium sp. C8]KLE14644.1 hypothetical protein AAT22_15710 [Clostridium sp. C8]